MRLWQVLFAIPIVILIVTISLLVQVKIEEHREMQAEFRHNETLIIYSRHILAHAIYLMDQQQITIQYQRRLISRLGQSPCVESAWLLTR